MQKNVLVIGLGRFGKNLALSLNDLGHEVLVIDKNISKVNEVANEISLAKCFDATNKETLKMIGADKFNTAIVAIGENIEASSLVVLFLKELGVENVIAKALNTTHGRLLEKIGADRIIFPERDMALRLAHSLSGKNFLEYLELSEDFCLAEFKAKPSFFSKSLQELDFRNKYGVNVIGIISKGQTDPSPHGETIIKQDDILIVTGNKLQVAKLSKVLIS